MSAESEDVVLVERNGTTLILTLNEPKRRNALSMEMREVLRISIETALEEEDLRAIVLQGSGGAFCAGGDMKSFAATSPAGIARRTHNVHRLVRLMTGCPVPIIAAVEGWALGAGLSLALLCDIIVAGRDARFGSAFSKIGLAPDLGALWTLPARVGIGKARLLFHTGRVVTAEHAEPGLVDELAEPGAAFEKAMAVAAEIAETAPLPTTYTKRLLAHRATSLDQVLEAEGALQPFLSATDDFREGFAGFAEKRPPKFRGN